MGLMTDRTWGVTVVHHGGSMAGYKSDWLALPDAGVGRVLLTNADEGQALLGPFMRRLMRCSTTAGPEPPATWRRPPRACVPGSPRSARGSRSRPAAAATLAARYVSPELGEVAVRREVGGVVVFDFGGWRSRVASRANDDGTVSFVPVDPAVRFGQFVAVTRGGRRTLVVRDGQHEYVYTEAP
jgi:hypothetical protein